MENNPKRLYGEGEEAPNGMSMEVALNKDNDTLPFGYFNPELEGKLTWICGKDPTGRIIGVFSMDLEEGNERREAILKDMDEARYCRDELIANGWKPLKTPKIEFSADGTPLNRKQKRFLNRKIAHLASKYGPE